MKSKYSLVVVVVRLVVCILPLSKFINQSLLNSSWILNLGLEMSSLTRLGNDDIFSEGRSLLRNGSRSRNFRKIFSDFLRNTQIFQILCASRKVRNLSIYYSLYILRRSQNFAKSLPQIWLALHRKSLRWRFCNISWPPQNIWTLMSSPMHAIV